MTKVPDSSPWLDASDGRSGTGAAIARGIAAGWVHVVVAAVAGPVQTYYLLRYLDTSDAGFWLVVLSFTWYLALFDLGIGPTLTRNIAFLRGETRASGSSKADDVRKAGDVRKPLVLWSFSAPETRGLRLVADLIATARTLYLALAAVLVIVGFGLGPYVVPHVAKRAFAGSAAYAWVAFVLGSAVNLLSTINYSALAGLGIVGTNRLARATAQVMGLVLAIVALREGYGVPGVATAWFVQNLFFLLAGPYLLRRLYPGLSTHSGRARATLVRDMTGPSLRWAGTNLGAAMIFAVGPGIISSYLGPAAVPQYVVVFQLLSALYAVSLIPAQASEPFVAHAYSAAEYDRVTTLVMRNLRHVAIPLVCGSGFLAVFGREVVTAWVGAGNFAGYLALWLFIALFVFETHHVVHATVVMATGHVIFLPAAIAAGLLTVGLAVALVPRLGVSGMVLSMFLAQLLTNNWYAPWYSLRLLGVRLKSYLSALAPLAWFALGIAVAAMACKAALFALGVTDARVVAGAGLISTMLAGTGLAWRLALDPAERQFVLIRIRRPWRLTAER